MGGMPAIMFGRILVFMWPFGPGALIETPIFSGPCFDSKKQLLIVGTRVMQLSNPESASCLL